MIRNPSSAKKLFGASFIVVIVAVIAIFMAILCVRTVDVGQVAVVTQFGTIKGVETAGLHVKSPFESYNYIDVTQQAVSNDYNAATKDNQSLTQTITAQVTVRPDSAESLYEKFKGSHMETLVMPSLADSFKSATASYTIEQVVANRGDLASKMLDEAKAKLDKYGIDLIAVDITNVELPAGYRESVEQRKIAEQARETAKVNQEKAAIEAKTREIEASSLSENNFKKMFFDSWNGELPQYLGSSNGLSLIMNGLENK